ncbi:MAG: hypothetical protein ACX93N_09805 [Pseudohaliea sp.]
MTQRGDRHGGGPPWHARPWLLAPVLMLLAALLVVALYLAFFTRFHPEFAPYRAQADAPPKTFPGARFEAVRARASERRGSARAITAYLDGEAVFRTPAVVDTADYPFLRVRATGLHPGVRLFLFWRIAERPDGIYHARLHHHGDGTYTWNLLRQGVWTGRVIELSIGTFGDPRGEAFVLEEVAFQPYGPGALVAAVADEWTAFRSWSLSSINKYLAAPPASLLRPAVAGTLWFLAGVALLLALAWLGRRRLALSRGDLAQALVIMFAISWTAQDLLVDGFRLRQGGETLRTFAGKPLGERAAASTMRCRIMAGTSGDNCRDAAPLPWF